LLLRTNVKPLATGVILRASWLGELEMDNPALTISRSSIDDTNRAKRGPFLDTTTLILGV
jgi:hypothetical protein